MPDIHEITIKVRNNRIVLEGDVRDNTTFAKTKEKVKWTLDSPANDQAVMAILFPPNTPFPEKFYYSSQRKNVILVQIKETAATFYPYTVMVFDGKKIIIKDPILIIKEPTVCRQDFWKLIQSA